MKREMYEISKAIQIRYIFEILIHINSIIVIKTSKCFIIDKFNE